MLEYIYIPFLLCELIMIYLASDHAGFQLKKEIIGFLESESKEYIDVGPHSYDPKDDYPDYVIAAAEKVAKNPEMHKGIIIGGSGQGELIAANKVKGIRAVLYYGGPKDIIILSRTHNNANVLSIGARFINTDEAKKVVSLWLQTVFPGEERHVRRIRKIKDYENS